MEIPDFNTWSTRMQGEKYLKSHYPEFYNYLLTHYPNISNIKEKIYLYRNNLKEPYRCIICGTFTKYDGPTKGYRLYCSSKCCNNDPNKIQKTKNNNFVKYGVENISQLEKIKEKKKQTSLRNYGVEHPSQLEEIKEKVKKTNLEKYGVKHPSQLEEIKEKVKKNNLKKYGVEHPSQLEEIKEKKKQTSLRNYGVEHPSQSEEVKQNTIKTFNKNYIKSHTDIIEIIEDDGEKLYRCKCPHKDCSKCGNNNFLINKILYHSRKYQNIELCTILNPIDNKSKNTSLEIFVKKILDDNNIEYISNERVCNNLELDIYIPSFNIGIECNGCFWHSDGKKSKNYHYHKYSSYKENGIQVLSIWEDWIKNKPNIVSSIILSKLGKYKEKIYARKCFIKKVDHNECVNFLEKNHIQGNSNSSIRLGLYYKDELVSLMCFSKKRRNMMGKNEDKEDWELLRFCNKLNTQVIGGAGKLLNHFIKNYNPLQIISFASHDISNGGLYEKLGFELENSSYGSYWYIDNKTMIRYHRYCFRKSELIKKGYDENLSEFQIMDNLNYFRIYDSGQSKYILKKELY